MPLQKSKAPTSITRFCFHTANRTGIPLSRQHFSEHAACVSCMDSRGRTIWIVDAHLNDGKRFIVHADEKLSAFVELEREVLTVTFYLQSIKAET
jgi:hypothetical protein